MKKILVTMLLLIGGVLTFVYDDNQIMSQHLYADDFSSYEEVSYDIHTIEYVYVAPTNSSEPYEEPMKTTYETQVFEKTTSDTYEILVTDEYGKIYFLDSSDDIEYIKHEVNQLERQITDSSKNNVIVIDDRGVSIYATYQFLYHNGTPTEIFTNNSLTTATGVSFNTGSMTESPVYGSLNDQYDSVKTEISGKVGYIDYDYGNGAISDSDPCANYNYNGDTACSEPLAYIPNTSQMSFFSENSNGELIYSARFQNPNAASTSYTTYNLGPAPEFMQQGVKYYSYDFKYFYTSYTSLVDNQGSGTGAVNQGNPYYNYYMYLPARSKSHVNESNNEVIARYVEEKGGVCEANQNINGIPTKPANIGVNPLAVAIRGNTFDIAEKQYGINKMVAIGIAINESGYGTSNQACVNNNFFGAGVPDDCPTCTAGSFNTPHDGVMYVVDVWFNQGYNDPTDWRFWGGHVGTKETGMNVKWATDPLWGVKNSAHMYAVDSKVSCGVPNGCGQANLKEYNSSIIAITNYNVPVYSSSTTNNVIYNTRAKNSVPIPHVVYNLENSRYKVQPYSCNNSNIQANSCRTNGNWNWATFGWIPKGTATTFTNLKADSTIGTNLRSTTFRNDSSLTFSTKVTYYDGNSETCLPAELEPEIVLDVDGNFNTKGDQIQPYNVAQDANNCKNWWVDFNTSELENGQKYYLMVSLPIISNSNAPVDNEIIYYSSPSFELTNSKGEKIKVSNENNRASITYFSGSTYDIATNVKSIYVNSANSNQLVMDLKIDLYDTTKKSYSCITTPENLNVIADIDGNLSTTNDQVLPATLQQNPESCHYWKATFDITKLQSSANYKVYAKFTGQPSYNMNKTSEQIYYTSGNKEIKSGDNTIKYFESPNDRLSFSVDWRHPYDIATNVSSVYVNQNNDYITMNLKINYYNPETGKYSCIDKNKPPKVVLDEDGNIDTTDDQIQPSNISRNSSDCNYWWVDFNENNLQENQEYKVIASIVPNSNNSTTKTYEQVYYTKGSKTSIEGTNKLNYYEYPNDRLAISFKQKFNYNVATSVNKVYLNANNNYITMNLKVSYYDTSSKQYHCINKNTPPKIVLDIDGNINTTNDQVKPVKITNDTGNCQNWWVDFKPSDLKANTNYKVIAQLPANSNNLSTKQSEQIYYTSGKKSSNLNDYTLNYNEIPDNRLTVALDKN